ncbi:hypothetical protein HYR99_26830 [Candidatus Poribacteria bacterium]|nr:hypothetical protein [Candidatus Poribacteria bacterium]
MIEGPFSQDKPQGMGIVRLKVICRGDSEIVLKKAKEVLISLVKNAISVWPWPDENQWVKFLPQWFVSRCAEELTAEEAEKWLKWWSVLSWEEQQRVEKEKAWSLSDFLYWFHPEQRTWHWWDAHCPDRDSCWVEIEVDDWPFPWGAFDWLFRASGAISVECEEE